jgi:hypothetical protein
MSALPRGTLACPFTDLETLLQMVGVTPGGSAARAISVMTPHPGRHLGWGAANQIGRSQYPSAGPAMTASGRNRSERREISSPGSLAPCSVTATA